MFSNKPYLIRAFYEWIVDNGCTPHVVINTKVRGCIVPKEFIKNDEIVFNISNHAIRDLKLGNELVEFRASFSGIVRIISAPVKAVLAIYAEENGQGMFFDFEEEGDISTVQTMEVPLRGKSDAIKQDKIQTSHLRLVD